MTEISYGGFSPLCGGEIITSLTMMFEMEEGNERKEMSKLEGKSGIKSGRPKMEG